MDHLNGWIPVATIVVLGLAALLVRHLKPQNPAAGWSLIITMEIVALGYLLTVLTDEPLRQRLSDGQPAQVIGAALAGAVLTVAGAGAIVLGVDRAVEATQD